MGCGKIVVFLTLNAFAEEVEIHLRCMRQIFLQRLITFLTELLRCLLLTVTSKHFTGCKVFFEVPELRVHCEMDFIAQQLIELQSPRLRGLWLDFG